MIFTERTENNEIVFNESKKVPDGPDAYIVDNGKGQYDVFYKDENIGTVDSVQDGRDHLREYRKDHEESAIEDDIFVSTNNGGSYIFDALYESYIESKIESEERLAYALKQSMVISEADYSNIKVLQESKLGDKIKATWKRFVAFIKGLIAKFMESMSNILLSEKSYLERYKDIILKKQLKDADYTFLGDYTEAINRLINTEIPLFDYNKYKTQLEAEDDGDLVKELMRGKDFNYDDEKALAEQFKTYFMASENGSVTIYSSKINMTDVYNFCYNFDKIKEVVDKDTKRLEDSTRAIEREINTKLNVTATNTVNNVEKPAESDSAEEESAVLSEKVVIKKKETSSAADKMSSTQNRDTDAEKASANTGANAAIADNKEANDISNAANKWIRVCRPIIAAKLTAYQAIAKDYMTIIRDHVRSYGGTDKKSTENDISIKTGTKYSKYSAVNNAQRDADAANAEADKVKDKTKK